MNLKNKIVRHVANLKEHWECNRMFDLGRLTPVLSRTYPLAEVGAAARLVQRNEHLGKIGVLCLAPRTGLGITDPEARQRHGEERMALWHSAGGRDDRA
ncbi:zinc-binding dehydrogenase [Nocardia tengchongensis]|uniref:zinc-binding dehydrogenase n=1 Tax=Nocardia tengchongensis TaxID=2055889 RepID=UPI0036CD1321